MSAPKKDRDWDWLWVAEIASHIVVGVAYMVGAVCIAYFCWRAAT